MKLAEFAGNDNQRRFVADESLACFLKNEMGFDLSRTDLQDIVDTVYKCRTGFDCYDDFTASVASRIAVHETYFLRHHEQFEWIENVWLPMVIDRFSGTGQTVRILSAGCATGEEPYSIYAHLQPVLQSFGIGLQVDAVDISENALNAARKGRYGLWSLRGVDQQNESAWLEVKSRTVTVQPWVKNGVNFFRHNLMHAFIQEKHRQYDLVLCRNVMVYMHPGAVRKLYNNLLQVMKPDAWLMPGPSDPCPLEIASVFLHWHGSVRLYAQFQPHNEVDNAGCYKHPDDCHQAVIKADTTDSAVKKAVEADNYSIVDSLLQQCRYDEARKMLEGNVERNPLDVRSYVLLSLLAMDMDDIRLASLVVRKARFLSPYSPYVVYISANLKSRSGDRTGEIKDLLWLKTSLNEYDINEPVEFCEEITIEDLKGVLHARLNAMCQ